MNDPKPRRRAVTVAALLLASVLGAWAGERGRSSSQGGPAATAAHRSAEDFYRSRPLYERPFGLERVPRGLTSLSARECGSCHTEIYREWRQSVHAQAWIDPQFQAELHKQPGVSWLCVNCHTPIRNQIDSLAVGLWDNDVERPIRLANPDYDPALRDEAITCASCHVRDGAVEGPFGNTQAPHAVRHNPALRSAEFCLRCHQAVESYAGKNFICTFTTGEEWQAGPYAAQGKICQDCHMPETFRPLMPGAPVRRTGSHGWIGSRLRKGHETIPALWDSLAARIPPGVSLRPGATPRAAAGANAQWSITVSNANAGHRLPTGDPERKVLIEVMAVVAGDTLASALRSIGQIYRWHPTVEKISDNRLAPADSTVVTLLYRVPSGPYRLVARAINERISDANAGYHDLPASYVRRAEVVRVEVEASGGR